MSSIKPVPVVRPSKFNTFVVQTQGKTTNDADLTKNTRERRKLRLQKIQEKKKLEKIKFMRKGRTRSVVLASGQPKGETVEPAPIESQPAPITDFSRVKVTLKKIYENIKNTKRYGEKKQMKLDKKNVEEIKKYLKKKNSKTDVLPANPNEFFVLDMNETSVTLCVERINNSGTLTFIMPKDIEIKYIDLKVLPQLPIYNEEMARFQAALDCIHTFGEHNYFNQDDVTLDLLNEYAKEMENVIKTQEQESVELILEVRWDPKLKFDPRYQDPTDDVLINKWANITTEEKSNIDTDTAVHEQVLDRGQENYTDQDYVKEQLKIRQWAETIATQQMPVGTQFNIYFQDEENGSETFLATVTDNSGTDVQFQYYDGKTLITETLDFIEDEFSFHENYVDNKTELVNVDEMEQDEIELQNLEETNPLTDDDADDVGDDDEFFIGETVTYYVQLQQSQGTIERKAINGNYIINGSEVSVDNIYHLADNVDYVINQIVHFEGADHTITKIDGTTAVFENESYTFDELNDMVAEEKDIFTDMKNEKIQKLLEEVDTTKIHTWKGKEYTMRGLPYLLYTAKEWAAKNKEAKQGENDGIESEEVFDEEQSEVVDLINTVNPSDVVTGISVYELDEKLPQDGELEEPPEVEIEDSSSSEEDDEEDEEPINLKALEESVENDEDEEQKGEVKEE